jgi:hypothetical protein
VKFVDGRPVLITFDGRSISGEICLASTDELSLVLLFEDKLGPYEYLMPILWKEDGYVDLLRGSYVQLSVIQEMTPSQQKRIAQKVERSEVAYDGDAVERGQD